MVIWCQAFKCDNRKAKFSTLAFFILPKDKNLADGWITKIKATTLPKYIYLCKEDFEEQCFVKSVYPRNKLLTDKINSLSFLMRSYRIIFILA